MKYKSKQDFLDNVHSKFSNEKEFLQAVEEVISSIWDTVQQSQDYLDGNILDSLLAPLSPREVSLAIIMAAVTRGLVILVISVVVFSLIVEMHIYNIFYIFIGAFLGSFILGALGFITGLWAEKFDHTATITNFIITPLSFLSGVFYSIERLPDFFQTISKINPFFYIIDICRFGFLGASDGSIGFGLTYLVILSIIVWLVSYYLYKIGYKIKS